MGRNYQRALEKQTEAVLKKSVRGGFLATLGARVACGGRVPVMLTFSAQEIAEEAGVAVEVVKELMRECIVPDEVRIERGSGQLVATFVGHGKIRELLDTRLAAEKTTPSPAPVPAKGAETLRVIRVGGVKRLICNRTVSGLEVICCVQKTEHFMPGMELKEATPGAGGMWFYTGRLPRRRGRW